MLNDWQMSRICMATRSYHIPKGIWLNDTDVKGYRYDASSRVFPVIS